MGKLTEVKEKIWKGCLDVISKKVGLGRLSVVIMTATLFSCIFFYIVCIPNAYEIFVNGSSIACVKDISTAEEINNNVISNLQSRFKELNIKDEIYGSKVIANSGAFNDEESIKKNILNAINVKVKAVKLVIDGQDTAVLASVEECKSVLNKAADTYLGSDNNIKLKSISNKIDYKMTEVYVKDVDSLDNAVTSIINNKETTGVSLKITALKTESKPISFQKEVRYSNDLSPNSSKVIQNGENGEKIVEEEVLFIGGKSSSTKVVKESVTKKPKNTVIAVGKEDNSDKYVMAVPSSGSISSGFGARWGKVHEGIDIAAASGTDIHAAMDGKVIFAGWEDGYGNIMKLQHNNDLVTIYGHCSKLLVSVGDSVKKGQVIGKVGSTGRSTGPHLHFEVRIKGKAVDPYKYIYKN